MSVYVIDDEAYEGTEDFYATLTTTETRVRIFEANASITIIDNGKSQNSTFDFLHMPM